jgi:hypothetical protein
MRKFGVLFLAAVTALTLSSCSEIFSGYPSATKAKSNIEEMMC